MSLIIRIDVDRPYGRTPFVRHLLSRVASDHYFPRLPALGYLRELAVFLDLLWAHRAKAHIFFRRCTLPKRSLLKRIQEEGHAAGLHLENSRMFETFLGEKLALERCLGQPVLAFSKHGSGGRKFGRSHYAPYEPDKYLEWGARAGMKAFLGNLEDPRLPGSVDDCGFVFFPSAFWLEPPWRDTHAFPVRWLLSEAAKRDVVLLLHPENVLESGSLVKDLEMLLSSVSTKILPGNGGSLS